MNKFGSFSFSNFCGLDTCLSHLFPEVGRAITGIRRFCMALIGTYLMDYTSLIHCVKTCMRTEMDLGTSSDDLLTPSWILKSWHLEGDEQTLSIHLFTSLVNIEISVVLGIISCLLLIISWLWSHSPYWKCSKVMHNMCLLADIKEWTYIGYKQLTIWPEFVLNLALYNLPKILIGRANVNGKHPNELACRSLARINTMLN